MYIEINVLKLIALIIATSSKNKVINKSQEMTLLQKICAGNAAYIYIYRLLIYYLNIDRNVENLSIKKTGNLLGKFIQFMC